MDDMTPTDKLRALLDERGIEYGSGFGGDTLWTGRDGIDWRWDKQEDTLAVYSHTITPEQAITATVGPTLDQDLQQALDFMRIWITDDAHLGESDISYELEKAEGLRNLEAIEHAIAATVGGYGITFAPTLERPPETMVGETVYDSEGVAVGWIVNARIEEATE